MLTGKDAASPVPLTACLANNWTGGLTIWQIKLVGHSHQHKSFILQCASVYQTLNKNTGEVKVNNIAT